MRPKTMLLTLSAVLASLSLLSAAHAGTSVSISVGCSVPEIPGVNVPLRSDTSIRQDQMVRADTTQDESDGRVRTFYSR